MLSHEFRDDRSGAIGIIFALIIPVLVASIGVAVDLGVAVSAKLKAQAALDSAVLAGVAAAKSALNTGASSATAIAAAKAAASNFVSASAGGSSSPSITFTIVDGKINGAGSWASDSKTYFMGIMGKKSIALTVTSSAEGGVSSYLNVYLLVDVSASMLLPSTEAGITKMRNGTGCALACHDSKNGKDSYAWAIKNGIQLRYDVVNQGVQNLLTYLQSNASFASKVKVGLWTFDHELKNTSALTSNFASVSNKFPAPSLASNDEAAATLFDTLIPSFVSTVGVAGDGTTAEKPKKLVIIATDGVNDPTRAWTWNLPLRDQVRAFGTGFCKSFSSNGVTIAIIHTPYYPMAWDWGYNATLGQPGSLGGATRVDDIPIALNTCAGSNYMLASDVSSIQKSFTTAFQKASPIRLTQ